MRTSPHWLFYIFFLLLCCLLTPVLAQENQTCDAVYLKDSSVVYGQIMKYEPTGVLVLQLGNGKTLEYPAEQILKTEKIKMEEVVTQEPITINDDNSSIRNTYEMPKIKKLYGWGAIGNIFSGRYGDPTIGLSIELCLGHQFHPAFMLGGGIGVTTEYVQSIGYAYASIRGNVLRKNYSPFYQVDIGYGRPLVDKDPYALIAEPQAPGPTVHKRHGGLYLHPSVGFRFASKNTVHTYLAAGCVLQWVKYEGIDWNNFEFVETVLFARPSLRVGIVF